jgi:hypothetical protein
MLKTQAEEHAQQRSMDLSETPAETSAG